MSINAKKTKLIVAGKSSNGSVKILLEGNEIEQVEDFKFLGSTKTTHKLGKLKNRIAIDIKKNNKSVEHTDVEEYFTAAEKYVS